MRWIVRGPIRVTVECVVIVLNNVVMVMHEPVVYLLITASFVDIQLFCGAEIESYEGVPHQYFD